MDTTRDAPPTTLRRSPSWLINQAGLYAQHLVNDRLAAVGARRAHFSVLSSLAEYGPASQADLGRRCHLDRSDIAALAGELDDAGYIARVPDPADRRRNIVSLTAEGERRLAALGELVAEAQKELLAPLDHEEREQLRALMTRVVEHHAERRGGGWA